MILGVSDNRPYRRTESSIYSVFRANCERSGTESGCCERVHYESNLKSLIGVVAFKNMYTTFKSSNYHRQSVPYIPEKAYNLVDSGGDL